MESKLGKIILEKLNSDVLSEEEFKAYIRSFDKENLVSLKDAKKQLGI